MVELPGLIQHSEEVFGGGHDSKQLTLDFCRAIEFSVHERHEREDVQGVLLWHRPNDLRGMGGRISHCAEEPYQQVADPLLLADLGVRAQAVDRDDRRLGAERLADQVRAIASEPRQLP